MRVLCYGQSEVRQRARCEFFMGAGCVSDWSTNPNEAICLLKHTRYDGIVLCANITHAERELIESALNTFSPEARVFTLPTCSSPSENTMEDMPLLLSELPGILSKLKAIRGVRVA